MSVIRTNSLNELLDLLKRVCTLLENSEPSDWSPLSPQEVKMNIESQINLIRQNKPIDKDQLTIEFVPTSTLQEIAMVSGWHREYVKLAERFDTLIGRV